MRGSYLMKRYIAAAEATRTAGRVTGKGPGTGRRGSGGRRVSRRQIARLTESRIKLETSRSGDTLDAALRELVSLALTGMCEAPRLPRAGDDVALYTIHGSRAGHRRTR